MIYLRLKRWLIDFFLHWSFWRFSWLYHRRGPANRWDDLPDSRKRHIFDHQQHRHGREDSHLWSNKRQRCCRRYLKGHSIYQIICLDLLWRIGLLAHRSIRLFDRSEKGHFIFRRIVACCMLAWVDCIFILRENWGWRNEDRELQIFLPCFNLS